MNLTEAFQALDKLDEEVFSVTDTDLSKLQDFMTSDDSIDEVDIFNLDAECDCEEESHEGETVLDCCVCHSKLLKPVEEVIVDEESELVNKGEECPYCFSTEGYKVVGEIKSVEDDTIEADDDADDEIDECTDAEGSLDTDDTPVITEDIDSDFEDSKEMWEMEDPDFDLEEYIDDFYTKAVKELSKKYKDLEVEPSIQSGRGTVFASYTRNDGKNVRAEWSYEDEVDSLEGAFLDATSADEFFAAVKSFIEENLKNAVAVEESLKESAKVDLLTKDNTIASVLKDNMDKLYSITNPNELRNAIIEIVDASNIADKPAVQKLKRDLFSKKSVSALLSTIATYMTGDKVIKTNRRGKMTEDVADNLGTDLDKYQKWVDYDMKKYHKISDKTNNEIRKAGLQVVKDKYGYYQVIAGKYDESLKESFDVQTAIDWYIDSGAADADAEEYCPENPDDWNVDNPYFEDRAISWFESSPYSYTVDDVDDVDDAGKGTATDVTVDGMTYVAQATELAYNLTKASKSVKGDVIIPETIRGVPVKYIDDEAFMKRSITSIVIPKTVTHIGFGAFEDCKKLTRVEIHGDPDMGLSPFMGSDNVNIICHKDSKVGKWAISEGIPVSYFEMHESKSIKESVKDVTITTDDSRTTMTSEDNGKVSVTTEPIETSDETDEIIAPVSEETEREIEINSIDKDTIEEVTEKCLKENFNNVTFFRTNNVTRNTNAFVVEGVIGLKSGKKHNTRFLFESSMTDNNKVSFSGKNRTLKNKSLSLIGTVDKNNKLISESLTISNASNDVKGE